MKYEVIHFFIDLCDHNHAYNVGDTFPRTGVVVSDERIKELSGSNNRQKVPLIKEIAPPVEEVKPPAEEVKPKRRTTKKKKVEKNVD